VSQSIEEEIMSLKRNNKKYEKRQARKGNLIFKLIGKTSAFLA
jgi:hypothetical protein